MAFTVMYPDNSGIQYAVRYDDRKELHEIEFDSIDTVEFPIDRLDWLIDALTEIKANLKEV